MKHTFTTTGRHRWILILSSLWLSVFLLHGQTSHQVEVSSNKYSPAELTVEAGDTVIWTNVQGNHNVNGSTSVFKDNPESFGNNVAGPGWTYSFVFNTPGVYDYQCDPHIAFNMFGKVIVQESSSSLTINFSGMTPHVGQMLWLSVMDDDTGDELARVSKVVETTFSLKVDGIIAGNDYTIEFFSDHNANGYYDAPGTDHAWRVELKDVSSNEVVDFTHNTEFKDIEWEHKAFVNLSGMGPHVGQEIYFALIDGSTGEIIDRKSETVLEDFMVDLGELLPGRTYHVDFFSDHNGNGYYDAPPVDHAWRLEIAEAKGDEELNFSHNTSFTDIDWKHRLEVKYMGMTPHLGQMLTLYVREKSTGTYLDTVKVTIEEADFKLKSYVLEPGQSYMVDFYTDHNGNGSYDAPPADHAWRLDVDAVSGDTEIEFTHNISFTDIFAVTGLFELTGQGKVSLYPNPVQSVMHISVSKDSDESLYMNLYSLAGVKVLQEELGRGKEIQSLVDLSNLEGGVYLLELRSGTETNIRRIVKH